MCSPAPLSMFTAAPLLRICSDVLRKHMLIVGLGNPGPEYAKTRHNIGFRCLDIVADKLGCAIDKGKFQGLYGVTSYHGNKIYLLKPLTYMNLSGRSVLQLSAYFQIPPERIIVLFDDISLEPGRMRVRSNGSAGGHNGIKSIIQELGSQDFPRVKIGVGAKPHPDFDLAAIPKETLNKSSAAGQRIFCSQSAV